MTSTASATRKTKSSTFAELVQRTAAADKFVAIRPNKDGKLAHSPVYITGRNSMWKDHPSFSYSFASRVAGNPHDVEQYLMKIGMDDPTALEVLEAYQGDVLIHKSNSGSTAPVSLKDHKGRAVRGASIADVLDHVTSSRVTARNVARDDAKRVKDEMPHPYELPEIYEAHRKASGGVAHSGRSSGRQAAAAHVAVLLAEVQKDSEVYYTVTNFTHDGKGQRRVQQGKIPDSAKKLGSGDLAHFIVNPDKGRNGVMNFLTAYHVHHGMSVNDAQAKAREVADDITPGRGRGASRRARSRSRSPSGSRASSRASSKSRKSASPKKSTVAKVKKGPAKPKKAPGSRSSSKSSRASSPTKSRKPSAKRAATRAASPKRSPRSASPASSPDAARSPARSSPSRSPRRSPRSPKSPRTPTSMSPPRTATRTARFQKPPARSAKA